MKKSTFILAAFCSLAVGDEISDAAVAAYQNQPDLPSYSSPVGDATPQLQDVYNQNQTVADVIAATIDTADAPDNSTIIVTNVTVSTDVAKAKRAPAVVCTTRSYNGPQVSTPTDSPSAFLNYAPFASNAKAAAQTANIPTGYALVPDFVDLNAAAKTSGYLTYTTTGVKTYDPSVCAAKCNALTGCTAFNIFYERVPLVISPTTGLPDPKVCPGLSTSPSATLLKCAFYSVPFTAMEAQNIGQNQGQFVTVITGSNAYIKTSAPTIDGYQGPVPFNGGGINAPAPVNEYGYLRVQTFGQNVPYDPRLCSASCDTQTTWNKANPWANLGPCIFFNTYVLSENGANGVLTCVYFSVAYGPGYASFTGQYDAVGNYFGVGNSVGYYKSGFFTETNLNYTGVAVTKQL